MAESEFKKKMAKDLPFWGLGRLFEKEEEKRNKNNENGEEDTDDDDDDDDDDDKEEQLRKKLNPRANEFLKNIVSAQTIADHENERNFTNLSKPMRKGCKLLKVKKVLHEEKSEHHDIKIYESTKNGNVFMLDGAIWVTELDSINQKALISTLLISHEEPKDVLVIGGGDGAIVKKLLNHQTVESITVYEVDEEIIKLGHQYFSSLTSSLENPKVKVHIGDGNEFVKKQENAFDVIIIRSTNVQDDYLDKEYFEVIEKALKKEGVVSFIVDGKDTRDDDDDDIMPLVMILSERIFPVVHYFILPFQEHPGTLTRCLMCSLSPKNDFHCAFEKVNEEVGKPNWFRV